MRSKFFRILAAALLALAVPLQGFAVVTAGQCMTLGHHAGDSHAQGHDDADGHDHAAHGQPEDGGNNPHCGPCAACCASASIAGPGALSIDASTSRTEVPFMQSPPPGVQPDGVYRPPLAL